MTQQLSAQMIQHLQLLQMTTLELNSLVENSFLENPLVELVEQGKEPAYRETLYKVRRSSEMLEAQFVEKESLKAFLFEQIPVNLNKRDKQLLCFLIEALDERLFLTLTIEEFAAKFHISLAKAEEMISFLQTFDPVGVGSLNTIQFLCRHIESDADAPSLAKKFVEKELKAIAKMDIKALSKKYQVAVNEVIDTIHFIKELPRVPVVSLHEVAPIVTPDATIGQINGEWFIELEDALLPSVKLQTVYAEILKQQNPAYYQKCMKEYITLVQGIDFRKKTLYDILQFIVEEQQAFLAQRTKALKPMRLKDAADVLNLHESTISRAIKGKYVYTPFGMMAIQDFFVKSVGNVTASVICDEIAALIQQEPPNAPYSDQQIVELLHQKEIKISRRTVTKYREMLNIPSSHKRIYLSEAK